MSVTREDRYYDRPCPNCGGSATGKGDAKCHGFYTNGGKSFLCGDAHKSSGCKMSRNNLYRHRSAGSCDCGREHSPAAERPRSKKTDPNRIARGKPEVVRAVYEAWVELLDLSLEHQDHLRKRGLSDEAIARNQYRSLNPLKYPVHLAAMEKQFNRETLLTVPGFYTNNKGHLAFASLGGILIPIRPSNDRKIEALKVRTDKTESAKYLYISSSSHGGPSPGSPLHYPLGGKYDKGTTWIFESELKGDVCVSINGKAGIAAPAAGSAAKAVEAAMNHGSSSIILALDADWRTNPSVASSVLAAALACLQCSMRFRLASWDGQTAKGLDDLLAAGGTPIITADEEALRDVEITARGLGVEMPKGWVSLVQNESVTAVETDTKQTLAGRLADRLNNGGLEAFYGDSDLLAMMAKTKAANSSEYAIAELLLKQTKGFSAKTYAKTIGAIGVQTPSETPEVRGERIADSPYWIIGNELELEIETERGNRREKLANFHGEITQEIRRDTGEKEPAIRFGIRIKDSDGQTQNLEVAAKDYAEMAWVAERGGSRLIVNAGRGYRDHVRAAIQHNSPCPEKITTYCHTGWRQIDGEWVYLSGSGAIGRNGLNHSINVDLETNLARYKMPEPPGEDRLRIAIRAQLGLGDFGQSNRPASMALAAILQTAPIRAVFGEVAFAIAFRGPSGVFKTATAALANQHYGASHDPEHLLGWDTTANALMATLYALKDTLTVVDDFVPQGKTADRTHSEADRVVRAAGNQQGRGRLNSDGVTQVQKMPRGLILSTGEDRFRRASGNARTAPVAFSRGGSEGLGTVDVKVLTQCQADAADGLYAEAMAGFIAWLASGIEQAREEMLAAAKSLRTLATRPGDHARTPGIVAELAAAHEIYLRFAVESGAISKEARDEIRGNVWCGLMEMSDEARAETQEHTDPSESYLHYLRSAINSRRAYLADRTTGTVPKDSEVANACGWVWEEHSSMVSGHAGRWVAPNTSRIGWVDDNFVFLDPNAAYSIANKVAGEQGEQLPSRNEIHAQLAATKKLAKTDPRSKSEGVTRYTTRERIGQYNPEASGDTRPKKNQQSVLVIRCEDFWPQEPHQPESSIEVEHEFITEARSA